jgi:hypothetical protein
VATGASAGDRPLEDPALARRERCPAATRLLQPRRRRGQPFRREARGGDLGRQDLGAPGDPGHEVGQPLGALDRDSPLPLEQRRPVGGVRGPPARYVPHAAPHHAVGDAAPDAVVDLQICLDHRVHQVVRQVGAAAGTAHGEHDPVAPLDEGLDRTTVGHPSEGHPHHSSLRRRVNRFPRSGHPRSVAWVPWRSS